MSELDKRQAISRDKHHEQVLSARRKAAKAPRSNSIRGLFTASKPKTRCHRRERIPFLRASQGQEHRAFQQSAFAATPAPEAGPSYLTRTSPHRQTDPPRAACESGQGFDTYVIREWVLSRE